VPDLDDMPRPEGDAPAQDEAALAVVARHALHDEELVAALAAGALAGDDEADERTRAQALVDRCPACRAVYDDVAAIGGALRLDASFRTTAPRDFRLTVEDAHRLGGTVITRGPLTRLGRLVAGFARPVGASVAALGLVGVLVSSAMVGAAGSAQRQATDAGTTGSTTAGSASSAAPAAAPSSLEIAVGPATSPKSSEPTFEATTADRVNATSPTTWIFAISALAVALGLGLFVYGAMAGRRSGSGTPNR